MKESYGEGVARSHTGPESPACVPRRSVASTTCEGVGEALTGGIAQEELLRRQRDSMLRAVASRMLCRHGGLTQREAAGVLGLKTGGAISHQLRNLEEMLRSDRQLLKLVKRLDRTLAGKKR